MLESKYCKLSSKDTPILSTLRLNILFDNPKFIHRQSVLNAVRFTTVELSELENEVNSSTEKALEMERIAIHIGDLGAILGDIAYLMGKETYAVTRTLVINTMLEISGSRFKWIQPKR